MLKEKENKEALPISLYSFEIEDFKGIKKTQGLNLSSNSQWVFLTGENGFGKTSLLQAIALVLSIDEYILVEPIPVWPMARIYTIEKGERSLYGVEAGNNEYPLIFQNVKEGKRKRLNELATYGTSRLEITNDDSKNDARRRSSALYSLFNSDGRLLSIEAELIKWEHRDKQHFNNLKKTLLQVLDKNIRHIYIDTEKKGEVVVKYVELDRQGNELPPVTFNQLASGYKSIIAMVGDLLIRFYKVYPTNTEPKDFGGIVLIDELDVHLHPRMQKKIPGILSKVFPKIQFIASIHSPIPILGAPSNSVFLKVNRTKEEGITVEHLDYLDVRSLSPNNILSSPIFDFDDVAHKDHDLGSEPLMTEDNYENGVFSNVLKKKLRAMAKAANLDPNDIK